MARSRATTVQGYLETLTPDQREVVAAVREVVLDNLPKGYEEAMNWGMISYELPLERYPHTYNKQPFSYAALAAQKNYFTLYLNGAYADPKQAQYLAKEFKKRGKKLDMGKSCLRFKQLDDLPLDVIGKVIASTPPDKLIKRVEAARRK
jgi:hypothetical protein